MAESLVAFGTVWLLEEDRRFRTTYSFPY